MGNVKMDVQGHRVGVEQGCLDSADDSDDGHERSRGRRQRYTDKPRRTRGWIQGLLAILGWKTEQFDFGSRGLGMLYMLARRKLTLEDELTSTAVWEILGAELDAAPSLAWLGDATCQPSAWPL